MRGYELAKEYGIDYAEMRDILLKSFPQAKKSFENAAKSIPANMEVIYRKKIEEALGKEVRKVEVKSTKKPVKEAPRTEKKKPEKKVSEDKKASKKETSKTPSKETKKETKKEVVKKASKKEAEKPAPKKEKAPSRKREETVKQKKEEEDKKAEEDKRKATEEKKLKEEEDAHRREEEERAKKEADDKKKQEALKQKILDRKKYEEERAKQKELDREKKIAEQQQRAKEPRRPPETGRPPYSGERKPFEKGRYPGAPRTGGGPGDRRPFSKDGKPPLSKKPPAKPGAGEDLFKDHDDRRKKLPEKKKFEKPEDAASVVKRKKEKKMLSKEYDLDIDAELYELEKKHKTEAEKEAEKSFPKPVVPRKVKHKKKDKSSAEDTSAPKLKIPEKATTDEFALFIKISTAQLIEKMKEYDVWLSPTQKLTSSEIDLLCQAFEISDYEIVKAQKEDFKQVMEEKGQRRPPIVTVMGHIDHGKTTLLDSIRNTNMAARESGGITQHIGASFIETPYGAFCLIDTPGHSAFTAMRARGAKVCDIVILVVAADDGIQPQTIEAIDHARAAGLPIIVALNKIDKNNARPDVVKSELAGHKLLDIKYGGETQIVEISALKKINIEGILEAVQLQAGELPLWADETKPATGFILDSNISKGTGPTASVIITNGTLKVKDNFVCGTSFGRVKMMWDPNRDSVNSALPSRPVQVCGFTELPEPGDVFYVVADEHTARENAEERKAALNVAKLEGKKEVDLNALFAQASGDVKEMKVVLKTDVMGSLGALSDIFKNFIHNEVSINIIHSSVGEITENDIFLASSSQAMIIGFKVKLPSGLAKLIEKQKVPVMFFNTIFEIEDYLKDLIEKGVKKELKEELVGNAEIRAIFTVGKVNKIAGCYMKEGYCSRNSNIKVKRGDNTVFEGSIESLKREKNDVKEVKAGLEFGIKIKDFNDIEVGDMLEFYQFF